MFHWFSHHAVDLRISGRIVACVPQVNRLGIQPVLEISHLAQVAFLQSHEIQCQAAKSNSSSVFTPCLHSLAACDGNAVGVSALGQGGNCRTFESIPDAARNWVRVPQIGEHSRQGSGAAPRRTSAGDIGTCCCRTHGSGLLPPNSGTTCVASTAYMVLVTPRQMANRMPILVQHRDAVQYRHS